MRLVLILLALLISTPAFAYGGSGTTLLSAYTNDNVGALTITGNCNAFGSCGAATLTVNGLATFSGGSALTGGLTVDTLTVSNAAVFTAGPITITNVVDMQSAAGLLSGGASGDFAVRAKTGGNVFINANGSTAIGAGVTVGTTNRVGIGIGTAALNYALQVVGTTSANNFQVGNTVGVTCGGSPSGSFAVSAGIVTHC